MTHRVEAMIEYDYLVIVFMPIDRAYDCQGSKVITVATNTILVFVPSVYSIL